MSVNGKSLLPMQNRSKVVYRAWISVDINNRRTRLNDSYHKRYIKILLSETLGRIDPAKMEKLFTDLHHIWHASHLQYLYANHGFDMWYRWKTEKRELAKEFGRGNKWKLIWWYDEVTMQLWMFYRFPKNMTKRFLILLTQLFFQLVTVFILCPGPQKTGLFKTKRKQFCTWLEAQISFYGFMKKIIERDTEGEVLPF